MGLRHLSVDPLFAFYIILKPRKYALGYFEFYLYKHISISKLTIIQHLFIFFYNHGKTKRAWGQKRNVYFKYIF